MGNFTPYLAALGGLGFLLMWLGLTGPRRRAAGRAATTSAPAAPQGRIKLVENAPFFQGFLYSAARGLVGLFTSVNEQGELTTANARYLLLLQQADWYWAPGELSPPTPTAPFWNLETLWGTKVVSALAGGALGLVVLLVPSLALGLPPFGAFFGAFIGALQGWIIPDSKLKAAVKKRQHGITVEMAFRLGELAAYVSTGKSVTRAFRYLAGRPGGPFVAEIRRLLAVYDATSSLSTALERMIERNRMRALTEFGQQIQMVEQRGGSIGPALNVLSQAAQRNLKQRLEEQAADNAAQMGLPVSGGAMLVVFLLVGGPALYIVLSSL
jgi:hypothetical protein